MTGWLRSALCARRSTLRDAAIVALALTIALVSTAVAQTGAGTGLDEGEGQVSAVPADAAPGDTALFHGQYREAAEAYRNRLESEPFNPDLHYNLGLAYVHLGQLGRAAYHLTQAHFLDLGDHEIAAGRELVDAELRRRHAEAQTGTIRKGEPSGIFWLELFHRTGRRAVDLTVILASWLAFGLFYVRRRMPPSGRRDGLTVLALVAIAITLGAVTYRTGGQITKDQVRPAVIIDEAPVLREGPDPRAMERPAHDLYPGALVLVEDARPGWVELRLAEGETGWIDEGAVAHVALAP